MEADLQRRAPRAAPMPASNRDLVARIRAEIAAAGPMPFARFMELALYAPDLGYYTSPPIRAGRMGDFLTAPESHPIFGAAVAHHVAAAWRLLGEPGRFTVREYGAGSGALAVAIAETLAADEPELAARLRYEAVEINPHRREDMTRRLATAAPQLAFAAFDPVVAASQHLGNAFILANEFFDAFPVHVVEQSDTGLREVFVEAQPTGFAETVGPPSTHRLAERLAADGVELSVGQRAEIALGLDDWFGALEEHLESGVIVVIDYGDAASDLYAPTRMRGTLLGYVDQQIIDDPLVAVGRQDLTAHVDYTALERAAHVAGFATLGVTTQARYLLDLGLEALLERRRTEAGQSLGEYLELRAGIARLLDPRHTGAFRVLVLGKGIDPHADLPGLRRPAL